MPVSLSEQRREKEYKQTQTARGNSPPQPWTFYRLDLILKPQCHACKIDGEQRAEDSEDNIEWYIAHRERRQCALEGRIHSKEDI